MKGIFGGRVDILHEYDMDDSCAVARPGLRDEEVLALLGRRPCTCWDVAGGLGVHVSEAVKRLASLVASGKVKTVLVGGKAYYAVVEPGDGRGS